MASGAHIADVAHYVREGRPLTRKPAAGAPAFTCPGGGADAAVPALRQPVLAPAPRAATDVDLPDGLDAQGRVVHHELHESVIRSARRFTYEEVEALLQGAAAIDVSGPVRAAVLDMGRRRERSASAAETAGLSTLTFLSPTSWSTIGLARRRASPRSGESHRLIEEFMLLANETVAQSMSSAPFLYRIHGTPGPGQNGSAEKTLRAVGVGIPTGLHDGKPDALQKVLASVKGKPVEPVVNMMILRSPQTGCLRPKTPGISAWRRARTRISPRPFGATPICCAPARQRAFAGDLNRAAKRCGKSCLGVDRRRLGPRAGGRRGRTGILIWKRAQLMTRRVGKPSTPSSPG